MSVVKTTIGTEARFALSLDIYEALQKIAPEGDVKRLIQETIEKLVQT